jgi:hypothetical protein
MSRISQVANLVDLDAVQELHTCNAMDVEGWCQLDLTSIFHKSVSSNPKNEILSSGE